MSKMTMSEREKLYNEVWAEPLTTVCKRYNISDVALRKRCIAAEIPLPPQGYWAKLRAGQKLSQTPLPELTSVGKLHVSEYAVSYNKDLAEFTEEELLSEEPLLVFSERTKETISHIRNSLQVPEQLRRPHSLIVLHESQMAARAKHEKLEKRYSGLFTKKPDDYYSFKRNNVLDIKVNSQRIKRAYRIVDTLLRQVEAMEGSVSVSNYYNKDGGTICLCNLYWDFRVYEKESKRKKTKEEDGPIYILHMDFESSRLFHSNGVSTLSFSDEHNLPLENQLGEVIYSLFWLTSSRLLWDEKRSREESCRREEEKRQKEIEQRRQEEKEKVAAALAEAHAYRQAEELRAYAEAHKSTHQQNGDWGSETEERYQWLLDNADWLDPLKKKDDTL